MSQGVGTVTRARAGIYLSLAAVAVLLTSLLPTTTRAATTVTLVPVADAHVAPAAPNNNYGATNPLRTREGGGTTTDPTYRAYLKFDVSSLAGQNIQSATLRLFVPSDPTPNVQSVYRVTDSSWVESTITNANAPQPEANPVGSGTVALTGYNDISLGAGAITSSQLQTFFIKSAGNNNLAFSSREAATDKPQLVVVIADPTPTATPTDAPTATPTDAPTATPTDAPTATPTDAPTATPTATPTDAPTATPTDAPTATPTVAPTATPTATPTSTPGGGGLATIEPVADAQIRSDSANTNYGSLTSLRTREPSSGQTYRAYLKFAIPSSVGTVDSLRLRLFVTDKSNNVQGVYLVGDTSWNEASITWNSAPTITGSPIATSTPSTLNAYVDIDLPTSAVTPGALVTFGLKGSGTDSFIVSSREAASNHPQLVINGGGSPPPAPPVGAFDAAPASGFAPLTVTFTDRSTNGPTAWAWDFGDPASGSSNTSTLRNPTHTYADPGTYTVTLTPSNAAGPGSQATRTIDVSTPPTGGGNVFVGAGDIADCARATDEATAVLLDGISGAVFTAGDNTYPDGTAANFANCYGPTWGRHKARTKPAIGNHDYSSSGDLTAYFDYFGPGIGDAGKGYYSYDVAGWHIVVLNSQCSTLGGGSASAGCGTNSPQTTWLRQDLAASSASCTIAIIHNPRFTSKRTTPDGPYAAFWTALYNAGAEIVISGDKHNYERFAPQTPAGASDPSFGVRQFVVGTGGAALSTFGTSTMANSQVKNGDTHGVLKLTLHASSYDFQFVPVAGKTFTDSGVGTCHGAPSSATQTAAAEATAIEIQQSNLLNDRRRRPH